MYFQQAHEGINKWWLYLISMLGVAAAYMVGSLPLLGLVQRAQLTSGLTPADFQTELNQQGLGVLGINEHLLLVLIVLPFLFVFAALYRLITKAHKKSFRATLTSRDTFDWLRLGIGFDLWFILACVLTFGLLGRDAYVYQFDFGRFLPLLVIAILLVPIGAFVEELVFRSYLMKGLHLVTKSKLIPLFVTSIVFGLLHSANPEMQHGFFKFLTVYIFFGFFFGLIAILDKGTELAIGIHISNNVFVALILSTSDGTFSTPSIFQTTVSSLLEILPILIPTLSIICFTALFVTYKWSFSTLRVGPPHTG